MTRGLSILDALDHTLDDLDDRPVRCRECRSCVCRDLAAFTPAGPVCAGCASPAGECGVGLMNLSDLDRELIRRTIALLRKGRVVKDREQFVEIGGASFDGKRLIEHPELIGRACGCVCGDLMIARAERGIPPFNGSLAMSDDPLMMAVWEIAGVEFTCGEITALQAADRLERELLEAQA